MAVDIFIKIDGIEGESTDSKHKNEIDVLAWSWGASNSGNAHIGGGAGAGKVNVQDLSFTKYVDAASHALLNAVASGQHLKNAHLVVRKSGGASPLEYIKIDLDTVFVTSVSTGGSGGEDRLTENITLNFAKYKFAYQPQDDKGAAKGGAKTSGWDVASNIKY